MWLSAVKRRGPSRAGPLDQLQRDPLLVLAVVALGQVDGAHAAAAEDVDHEPWPEAHADERIRVERRLAVVHQPLDLERVLRRVGREHRFDLGAQTAIHAAHAVEIASALTLGQLERTLECCVEARPPVRILGHSHEVLWQIARTGPKDGHSNSPAGSAVAARRGRRPSPSSRRARG